MEQIKIYHLIKDIGIDLCLLRVDIFLSICQIILTSYMEILKPLRMSGQNIVDIGDISCDSVTAAAAARRSPSRR